MDLTKKIITRLLKENQDSVVVYHGSNKKFTTFNDGQPIFFVDDYDIAKTYGDYVYKAKLTMANPIVLDFAGGSTYYFLGKWRLPSELAKIIKEISDDIKNYYVIEDDVREELDNLGFSDVYGEMDGIIMQNIKDSFDWQSSNKNATNYVVFNKSQIRF